MRLTRAQCYYKTLGEELQRLAGGADEIAQGGDVWTVGTNAAGVHGKSETLREVKIDAGVVQLRQTETCGWLNAIHAGRIDRTRRTMTMPRAASQFVKLFPVAFVPSVHRAV